MRQSVAMFLALALGATATQAENFEEGADLFVSYCATCHGLEARGNGPMSAILTLLPTDLTQLAAEEGGTFPTSRVVARIDGRDPLVAHGSPMPIFGEYFEGKGIVLKDENGEMIMTSQPVVDLVAYLKSLQE